VFELWVFGDGRPLNGRLTNVGYGAVHWSHEICGPGDGQAIDGRRESGMMAGFACALERRDAEECECTVCEEQPQQVDEVARMIDDGCGGDEEDASTSDVPRETVVALRAGISKPMGFVDDEEVTPRDPTPAAEPFVGDQRQGHVEAVSHALPLRKNAGGHHSRPALVAAGKRQRHVGLPQSDPVGQQGAAEHVDRPRETCDRRDLMP
jgi:hypothetical protein